MIVFIPDPYVITIIKLSEIIIIIIIQCALSLQNIRDHGSSHHPELSLSLCYLSKYMFCQPNTRARYVDY